MPSLSTIVGLFAGALQLIAYIMYWRGVIRDRIRPNPASWSIWAFTAVLEAASYVFVAGDWVKSVLPVTCSLSALALFAFCITRGKFQKLTRWEWFVVIIDIIALLAWWHFGSAVEANFLFVLSTALSFLPISLHVWADPTTEDACPWVIWTLAYFCMTLAVIMRWEKWEDLVYPLSLLILHGVIAGSATDKPSHKQPRRLFQSGSSRETASGQSHTVEEGPRP